MIKIITHRGLDPDKGNKYFRESSYQAFLDQLRCGYGLEFDLQFTKDNQIVICHSASLESISNGHDKRLFKDLTAEEIVSVDFCGSRLCVLEELLEIIAKTNNNSINAIHFKYSWQEEKYLKIILEKLKNIDFSKFIIFDVKVIPAKWLKEKEPRLMLAPSVAHKNDVKRYNSIVGGTLFSFEEALDNKNLFDWVWLDEWDRVGVDGDKKFYTKEVFKMFKNNNLKIALVSPELHATSPGLLGGEAHQDARDKTRLFKRIKEIISLKPDIICTDYPDKVIEIVLDKKEKGILL